MDRLPKRKKFRDAQNRRNSLRITKKIDNLLSQALAIGELEAELRLAEYALGRYVNQHVIQLIRESTGPCGSRAQSPWSRFLTEK